MEVTLILNGYEIDASEDDQERVILGLASGDISRDEFAEWLADHIGEVK
jgi:death-on-curing protein